ncbi:MAG: addiction module toxin, HicA family [Calditrichaeota bacterium]|nr:addiction module toxin, HicA family [Calditrichota bacterium]
MGRRFPSLNGRMIDKRLRDLGCQLIRQSGGHKHYSNPYRPSQLITYSDHPGDVPRGVIEDIIEDLGFTKEQFYDFNYLPNK